MEIKMNIERKGTLTGTCGWVAEQLKGAKVVIENDNAVIIFANGRNRGVCGVNNDENYYGTCANVTFSGKFWYASSDKFSADSPYCKEYIFNVRLTKKAKEKVDDFIDDVTREFIKQWEENE